MTAAWEDPIVRSKRRARSAFVATGQTGILLAGRGLAVDRVIADFVAGAAEALVLDAAKDHDVVVVEGQGSLLHPGYARVTLELSGTLPHSMVLCHQPSRGHIRHGDVAVPPLPELVRRYEDALAPLRPGRVVAVAQHLRPVGGGRAAAIDDATQAAGLPAADPVRDGGGSLAAAVLAARVAGDGANRQGHAMRMTVSPLDLTTRHEFHRPRRPEELGPSRGHPRARRPGGAGRGAGDRPTTERTRPPHLPALAAWEPLLPEDPWDGDAFERRAFAVLNGQRAAWCTLDTALWDLRPGGRRPAVAAPRARCRRDAPLVLHPGSSGLGRDSPKARRGKELPHSQDQGRERR